MKKLQYRKAGAAPDSEAQGDYFSFDLGGTILGGEADGEIFLAETKKYKAASDQGTQYREFLSKCYRVESDYARFCDNFFWITWAPFLVTTWDALLTHAYIQAATTENATCRYIALGPSAFDLAIATAVAETLLIVVLADGQEVVLSLHGRELMHVRKALLEFRGAP